MITRLKNSKTYVIGKSKSLKKLVIFFIVIC